MLIRRGSAKRKHGPRVAWLQPHLTLYADVPGIGDDVTPEGREALDRLCALMHARQLFGQLTPEMQRETVRRLLSELRGEYVAINW